MTPRPKAEKKVPRLMAMLCPASLQSETAALPTTLPETVSSDQLRKRFVATTARFEGNAATSRLPTTQ
jgi:hypothetical protein